MHHIEESSEQASWLESRTGWRPQATTAAGGHLVSGTDLVATVSQLDGGSKAKAAWIPEQPLLLPGTSSGCPPTC